jgi:dienelactone hydrolase
VGLIDDTCAGVEWVRNHPAVDPERIVLIGISTGSDPALLHAATDFGIRAMVGNGRRLRRYAERGHQTRVDEPVGWPAAADGCGPRPRLFHTSS